MALYYTVLMLNAYLSQIDKVNKTLKPLVLCKMLLNLWTAALLKSQCNTTDLICTNCINKLAGFN